MFLSPAWIAQKLRVRPDTKVLQIGSGRTSLSVGEVTVVGPEQSSDTSGIVPVDVSRQRLPFADGHFDVCICTEVLAGLPDPTLLLREMQRVAGAGYIETPHRGLESSFSLAQGEGAWPGFGAHRWLFEIAAPGQLRVIDKSWYLLHDDAEKVLSWGGPSVCEFFWRGSFQVKERRLQDAKGDHWHELVGRHNEFVAQNRAWLTTAEDVLEEASTAKQIEAEPVAIAKPAMQRPTVEVSPVLPTKQFRAAVAEPMQGRKNFVPGLPGQ